MKPAKQTVGIAIVALLFSVGESRLSQAATAESSILESQRSPSSEVQRLTGETQTRSYQEREARHPEVADFRGGDSIGIYIGGSAGLLVVVLLVLLLLR
jgi:hypothetical protein